LDRHSAGRAKLVKGLLFSAQNSKHEGAVGV
jgi:hypothetical protein